MRFTLVPSPLASLPAVLLLAASPLHAGELRGCTAEDRVRWDALAPSQFVSIDDSKDPTRFIGAVTGPVIPATDGIHKWIPKDIVKQTVCGTLDHVGFFHNITAEYDWDNYIKPFDPWRSFADHPAAEPCEQDPSRRCVSAEVTPPSALRTGISWWNWEAHSCSLVNHGICVYGPWVGDDGHGNRPEIHPAQALWWRESSPERGSLSGNPAYILLIQDASARFEHRSQFERKTSLQPWAPWVPEKWDARFRVGFTLKKDDGPPPIVSIAASGHRRQPDTSDPDVHAWPESGKPLLRWTRSGPSWRTVSVAPFDAAEDACEMADGSVRGSFVLEASLRDDFCATCAAEGFSLIRILQRSTDSPMPLELSRPDPLGGSRKAHLVIEDRAEQVDEPLGPDCATTKGLFGPGQLPGLHRVRKWRVTVGGASAEDAVHDLRATWRVVAQEGCPKVALSTGRRAGGIAEGEVVVTLDSCQPCDYLVEATITTKEPGRMIEVLDSRGNLLDGNTLVRHLWGFGLSVSPAAADGTLLERLAEVGHDAPPQAIAAAVARSLPGPKGVPPQALQEDYGARRALQAAFSAAADGALSREEVRSLICDVNQYYRSTRGDFAERCRDAAVRAEAARRRRVGLVAADDLDCCCTAQHIGLSDELSTR